MANNPSLLGAAGRVQNPEPTPVGPNGRAPDFSGLIQSLRQNKKPTVTEALYPNSNFGQGFFARFTPR